MSLDYIEVSELNSLDEQEKTQVDKFINTFSRYDKSRLQYIIRAPGRVNLIGDHVDYHGFAVLPMAIQNCIMMACSIGGDDDSGSPTGKIRILNEDPDYSTFSSDHSLYHGPDLSKSHKWYHYILCGYHGVLVNKLLSIDPNEITDHARRLQEGDHPIEAIKSLKDLKNLTLLVASNLPPASGLSSSSALVCASAIATEILLYQSKQRGSTHQGLQIDSQKLAEACSKFEHLVGTHGGGMDQAVIMTAQDGYAKFVEFAPIFRCQNVRLPANVAWLVSHCGSDYPKAATSAFNLRVLETKIGAALIAQQLDKDNRIQLDQSITLSKIKSVLFSGLSTERIIEILRTEVFSKDSYTMEEVCKELNLSIDQLKDRFDISAIEGDPSIKISPKLRCEHVFEEAERVIRFKSICDTNCDIRMLGELMTQGHYSLRDKYLCSHPALDDLVRIALDAGALGARLTGAGWGGCIVVMVEVDKCDTVIEQLRRTSKFTFQTEPCKGCKVIKV